MQEGWQGKTASRHLEDLRQLRLMGFLRELVRTEGLLAAARALGVNRKTIDRACANGRLTGRMAQALERLLWSGEAPVWVRQQERLGGLEQRVHEVGSALDDVLARVSGGAEETEETEEQTQPDAGARRRTAGSMETIGAGERPRPQGKLPEPDRRDLVVTAAPGEDDAAAYGASWPVVAAWRRLRRDHPDRGGTLAWLQREEELLAVELTLLEAFGLTLPPETEPLRGFGRRGQVTWRRRALRDTRRARVRREALRWLRRVLTLGLWWR